jgi:hypothetical protein
MRSNNDIRAILFVDTSVSPTVAEMPLSFDEQHISQPKWWCTTTCGPLVCEQGRDDDECWSRESMSMSTFSGDDHLAALRRTVSIELRDLDNVQRLAMPRPDSISPTKRHHSESSNVKFSDPLVTSLKTRWVVPNQIERIQNMFMNSFIVMAVILKFPIFLLCIFRILKAKNRKYRYQEPLL